MAIEAIQSLFEQLDRSLKTKNAASFFTEDETVYIYGAGNAGKDLFRFLKGKGIPVAAFLDRKAQQGSRWEEVPILSPEGETLSEERRRRSHVIVAIFNRDTEMPPILKFLKSLGYGRVTSFLEFHDRFAAEWGNRFWLTGRDFYTDKQEPIEAVNEIWSDETSREVYQAVLKFRFTMDYDALPSPCLDDQYFPKDLPAWPNPLRFIDCGAFDGDTLQYLLDKRMKVGVDAIAAFEPDLANFSKLAEAAQAQAVTFSGTLSLFPCGVGSATEQIRFSSGQGEGSCASESGNGMMQVVTLDEALPCFRPNMIKMDIEGAESAALHGSRRLIEAYRPVLAICVYHCPDHLWAIPLLAQAWLRGGRHYLRAHTYNGFDLVYYWVP